jgi:hypothetical protein
MWRCPHCGTPQAETARCWVCRRSSTTCSTCVHFRASLAAGLGTCGLDPRRRPLTGRELRGCWTAPAAAVHAGGVESPRQGLPMILFEAIESLETDWTARPTLFGDAEA